MPGEALLLVALFLLAATVYSMAGFGGGSAYIAMLTLAGVPIAHVAVVALVCNVIVVAGGSWHFARAGHVRLELVLPFLVTSVPAAYLGGRLALDVELLQVVTAVALVAAGVLLLVRFRGSSEARPLPGAWGFRVPAAAIGALLGGLAGVIGIGGGIFLAPVLHLLGWGTARQVAAVASVFILVNSLAGLVGKAAHIVDADLLLAYAPLCLAVLVGGQFGSRVGAWKLPAIALRRITAVVVLFAAVNLLVR